MHKPQKDLAKEIEQHAKHILVNGIYSHYKDPGKTYKVLYLGVIEQDDSICVIYQALQDEHIIFVRQHAFLLNT